MDETRLDINSNDPRAGRANELARELIIARHQLMVQGHKIEDSDIVNTVYSAAVNEALHDEGGPNRIVENIFYLVSALALGGATGIVLAETATAQPLADDFETVWANAMREHGSI
jgi:hypothetical protein